MALVSLIKLDSVNNLSDARYAAGMGVQLIGLPLKNTESEKIQWEVFRAIAGWISGPAFIAELEGKENLAILQKLTKYVPLTGFEIDFQELEQARYLAGEFGELQIILNFPWQNYLESIKSGFDFTGIEAVILSLPSGLKGPELLSDLNALPERNYKLLLRQTVTTTIFIPEEMANPVISGLIDGYCLVAGEEERPGLKNYDHLAPILEVLEVEE